MRIILQETLSIDVRRAYAGILPEEKARENESIGQALKHIDNVLRKLEKLGKETNPNGKEYDLSQVYRFPLSDEVSADYVDRARPVIRTRLVQAGARLA